MSISNPYEDFTDRDAMLEQFEAFCRQPPNYYNLTRSADNSATFWALSTERAWLIWQAAVHATMEGM